MQIARRSLIPAAVLAVCLISFPGLAFAAPWDDAAKGAFDLIMSIVRWVAIIAVVACGIAAMAGKLSWEWAIKIIVGLVLVFGATQVVDYFRAGMGG